MKKVTVMAVAMSVLVVGAEAFACGGMQDQPAPQAGNTAPQQGQNPQAGNAPQQTGGSRGSNGTNQAPPRAQNGGAPRREGKPTA